MPRVRPTGGIFARLDSNGNLNFYNVSGTVLAKFQGSFFSATQNRASATLATIGTTTQVSGSNWYGTAFGYEPFTNNVSGVTVVFVTVHVIGAGSANGIGGLLLGRNTNSAFAGLNVQVTIGGPGDTQIGFKYFFTLKSTSDEVMMSMVCLDTAATTGTAYTYELLYQQSVTNGQVSLNSASIVVQEL